MTNHKTIDEIRKLSKQSRLLLFGEVLDNAETNTNSAAGRDTIPSASPEIMNENNTSVAGEPETISKPMQNALDMMLHQSGFRIPFLFRRESAALANIKGGESLLRAESEALNAGILIKHSLPRAKTDVCFWELTDSGYARLKIPRPQWTSKGKYKHKLSVHRIAHTYKMTGSQTEIEHCRPDGKLVDLRVEKNDWTIFIEVCASWPVTKELINVEKDLQSSPLPDEIILAVTERKMKAPLQKAVSELNELGRPVKVMLAGDLISFLEIK